MSAIVPSSPSLYSRLPSVLLDRSYQTLYWDCVTHCFDFWWSSRVVPAPPLFVGFPLGPRVSQCRWQPCRPHPKEPARRVYQVCRGHCLSDIYIRIFARHTQAYYCIFCALYVSNVVNSRHDVLHWVLGWCNASRSNGCVRDIRQDVSLFPIFDVLGTPDTADLATTIAEGRLSFVSQEDPMAGNSWMGLGVSGRHPSYTVRYSIFISLRPSLVLNIHNFAIRYRRCS